MSLFANRFGFTMLSFLMFAFVALVFCDSQVVAQTATTDEGYRIEIALKPDKATILLNEPTFLSFEIKSYSPEDLCVIEGGDYRNNIGRPTSFGVTVTRDDGKSVPQPEVTVSMGGFIGCSKIPAHGSYIIKLFLPHWATFETTGSYLINVKRSLTIQSYSAKSSSRVEADVSANVTLIPKDENKMGDIINSLGITMLNIGHPESGRSAQALAYIDDKRVINYFAQALEKFGKSQVGSDEYHRSRQAAAALSHFDDDRALSALEAAMDSPIEDTRLDVASAFERSPHPKALDLLLKRKNDSYWFVRLRVAQGLQKIQSVESLVLLRKMLKDENEHVREAAQAGLNTREPN